MSETKLENAVDQACKDLTWIVEAVAQVRASGTLSEESYSFFELSSTLTAQLEHAKALLPLREIALTAAKAFPNQVSPARPDRLLGCGVSGLQTPQGTFIMSRA